MSKRECGDCRLCCKLLGIEDPEKPGAEWKPGFSWCEHCNIQGEPGCKIYETRPQDCQDFDCLWLQGRITDKLHPMKTRAVLWERLLPFEDPRTGKPAEIRCWCINVERRSQVDQNKELRRLVAWTQEVGIPVVIASPGRREAVGFPSWWTWDLQVPEGQL